MAASRSTQVVPGYEENITENTTDNITGRLTKLAVNALELENLKSKGTSKDFKSIPPTDLYHRLEKYNLKLRNPKEKLSMKITIMSYRHDIQRNLQAIVSAVIFFSVGGACSIDKYRNHIHVILCIITSIFNAAVLLSAWVHGIWKTQVPSGQNPLKKWRIAIKRIDPRRKQIWKAGPNDVVCKAHFVSDYNSTLQNAGLT